MHVFPDTFLERDGRFRAVMPDDSVPVIYVTAGGSYLCAACANALSTTLDRPDEHKGASSPATYELLYHGPEVCCEHCSRAIPSLFGDDVPI